LRAYRRACGLCQYCAEKWPCGHKCAPMVQLQVVQELWDLLQFDQDSELFGAEVEQDAQLNLILSKEAVSVGGTSKTLKFLGQIQGNPVIVLVDSRSSHSFINDKWAILLVGVASMQRSINVQVANGQVIQCFLS
jgi:hypothetical protein